MTVKLINLVKLIFGVRFQKIYKCHAVRHKGQIQKIKHRSVQSFIRGYANTNLYPVQLDSMRVVLTQSCWSTGVSIFFSDRKNGQYSSAEAMINGFLDPQYLFSWYPYFVSPIEVASSQHFSADRQGSHQHFCSIKSI